MKVLYLNGQIELLKMEAFMDKYALVIIAMKMVQELNKIQIKLLIVIKKQPMIKFYLDYIIKGVEKDENKAIDIFKTLAEKGYLNAKFQLGYCYYYGKDVEKDKVKALNFYKQAARKGNNMAQNNLALLYKHGKEMKNNLEKAIYWFNIAAENGNIIAQYQDMG